MCDVGYGSVVEFRLCILFSLVQSPEWGGSRYTLLMRPNKVKTVVQCFCMSRASVCWIFWAWKFNSQLTEKCSPKKKTMSQLHFELFVSENIRSNLQVRIGGSVLSENIRSSLQVRIEGSVLSENIRSSLQVRIGGSVLSENIRSSLRVRIGGSVCILRYYI